MVSQYSIFLHQFTNPLTTKTMMVDDRDGAREYDSVVKGWEEKG